MAEAAPQAESFQRGGLMLTCMMLPWMVCSAMTKVLLKRFSYRTLSIAGVAGQWAYPAADTLAGMKYAARRFLRRVKACRTR